jgi:hypothetical protein
MSDPSVSSSQAAGPIGFLTGFINTPGRLTEGIGPELVGDRPGQVPEVVPDPHFRPLLLARTDRPAAFQRCCKAEEIEQRV